MNELALFAGAGGGILGGHLLGWRTVCAVEWDAYAASVLVARQNDGCLPPFPIWDDVQTFDGRPWRGRVDIVSGGFPCQDISAAGKGAGIDGERSGMWKHMARVIGEVRPMFAFVENSPNLTFRGLGIVLGDLAEMGYNARWGCIPASYAGAPHGRDRIWIVADSMQVGRQPIKQILPPQFADMGAVFEPDGVPSGEDVQTFWSRSKAERQVFMQSEICRMDDGMAEWVGELETLGNGQVSCVAALAWLLLGGQVNV